MLENQGRVKDEQSLLNNECAGDGTIPSSSRVDNDPEVDLTMSGVELDERTLGIEVILQL